MCSALQNQHRVKVGYLYGRCHTLEGNRISTPKFHYCTEFFGVFFKPDSHVLLLISNVMAPTVDGFISSVFSAFSPHII